MDHLLSSNDKKAIQQLKTIFGLEALEDIRDFAMTIAFPRTYLKTHILDVHALTKQSNLVGGREYIYLESCHTDT
jgi:hypothetical protein